MTSSKYLWSGFLFFSFLVTLAEGWGVTSEPFKTKPNTHDNKSRSDRRDFLQSSVLAFATIASIGPLSPKAVMAAGSQDPFAALDSFAASVGSTPPSSLNPSSNKGSSNSSSDKGAPQPSGSSEMSEALKAIRKQKQIDPRTHG